MLPLMIGSFVMTFVVCCCTCVCISRINRRRAMLAAAANPGLLGNNPSTNSAYRVRASRRSPPPVLRAVRVVSFLIIAHSCYQTFQARGSYSRSQGVTAKTLQTFPTQSYHPGCMPAENAQYVSSSSSSNSSVVATPLTCAATCLMEQQVQHLFAGLRARRTLPNPALQSSLPPAVY